MKMLIRPQLSRPAVPSWAARAGCPGPERLDLRRSPRDTRINARLLKDLRGYQSAAFWVGAEALDWQIEIPQVPVIGLPLAEILPLQLVSIQLAAQIGVEPGRFFRSGKVTLAE